MSQEVNVRKASQQFYTAINAMLNGNSGSMAGVWSQGATVTSMHPTGGRQIGWDKVHEAFQNVAKMASGGAVTLDDQAIHVAGDVAYEIGNEHGKVTFGGQQFLLDHRVTNIYRLEAGEWKVIHHHTDTLPALVEFLKR